MKRWVWFLVYMALEAGVFMFGMQTADKLWIHKEAGWNNLSGNSNDKEIYFVQDRETGTRCYIAMNGSHVAISCLPEKGK